MAQSCSNIHYSNESHLRIRFRTISFAHNSSISLPISFTIHPNTTMVLPCSVLKNDWPFNSLRPSDAYMRRWTGSWLVQIIACRLFGAKPLSEPSWNIVNWTFRKKFQWKFSRNSNIFIRENAFENIVCETADILSRPQYVLKIGVI